jgi:hypothetical protein
MALSLAPVTLTATASLTRNVHANTVIVFNAAGGGTLTLPASTGDGDTYKIAVHTTVTSSLLIKVANATDVIRGGVAVSTDVAGITMLAGGTDDTITMNGSTTGGLAGSVVTLTDYKAGFWLVEGFLTSTGSEATPFSASVS